MFPDFPAVQSVTLKTQGQFRVCALQQGKCGHAVAPKDQVNVSQALQDCTSKLATSLLPMPTLPEVSAYRIATAFAAFVQRKATPILAFRPTCWQGL